MRGVRDVICFVWLGNRGEDRVQASTGVYEQRKCMVVWNMTLQQPSRSRLGPELSVILRGGRVYVTGWTSEDDSSPSCLDV